MAAIRSIVGVTARAWGLFLVFALFMCVTSGNAEALVASDADATEVSTGTQVGSGSRYLADGTYVFDVGKDTSFVVDVANSSKKAGAKIVMVEDAATKSQQWLITWDEQNQAYRIKNAKSGLYLTTSAAKAGKKMVSQAKYSLNNKKQLWVLEKDGAGYKILSRAKNSVGLGTVDAKAQAGSFVTTQTASAKKFKFYILPVDESLIKPETAAPESLNGKYVGVSPSSKADLNVGIESEDMASGATATLMKDSDSQIQKWYLKAINVDEGIYTIVNLGSGKALQVAGNGRHIGTDVVQDNVKGSNKAQQWWVRTSGKGKYTFTSCYNGLTMRFVSAKVGANVNLGLNDTSKKRLFKFSDVVPLENGFYQVSSWKKNNLSWGVANGAANKNKQLQVSTKKKTLLWQKFKLENVSGNVYAIRSVTSNRYIGEAGGKVVQGTRTSDMNQRWEVAWKDSGFVLRNVGTGHYLRVSGSVKNKAGLIGSSNYNAKASKFIFTKCRLIEDGTYFILEGSNEKKIMGISQADPRKDKAAVEVFDKANAQSYKFDISYFGVDAAGNEVYKIASTYSGKFLTSAGNKVYQKKKSKSKAQRWTAIVTSTGMLAFKNASTGKSMRFGSNKVTASSYSASSPAKFRWNLESTSSLTPEQLRAYEMLTATYSLKNYAITIDLTNHRLRVWKRANATAPWVLRNDWICSNGSRATPTPAVNVLSTGYKRFENPQFRSDGYEYTASFWYMTYIDSGVYIHTPLYRKGSMTVFKDARMGKSISGGCVRLQVPNAIWVYKNIKKGTRIITYY